MNYRKTRRIAQGLKERTPLPLFCCSSVRSPGAPGPLLTATDPTSGSYKARLNNTNLVSQELDIVPDQGFRSYIVPYILKIPD